MTEGPAGRREPDDQRPDGRPPRSAEQPDVAEDWMPEDDLDEPAEAEEREYHTGLPPKIEAWRQRSATGAILTGLALGLKEVFEPKREEPAVVMQTSGDPPRDLPVEADFEYQRPRQSVVNIRPWLLDDNENEPGAEPGPAAEEAPGGRGRHAASEEARGDRTDGSDAGAAPDRPAEP